MTLMNLVKALDGSWAAVYKALFVNAFFQSQNKQQFISVSIAICT
jgi:hypothetical protein